MSLIEPSNVMGPEPAAPVDPNHSYADTEAGGGGQSISEPQDVVVEDAPLADEPDSFDRKYVEELRRENAKWRTRAHEYEETFSPLDESLRQGWLELINLANSGEPDAMNQLASMLGFEVEEETPTDQPQEPALQQMTPEQYRTIAREEAQALREAENEERQQADSIRAVTDEATKLGYAPGSVDYIQLLYYANEIDQSTLTGNQTLLQAADAKLKDYQQQQYDAFVATKTAQAGGSPIAPSGNGASPSIATTPKTWDEARDSLHERLSNT